MIEAILSIRLLGVALIICGLLIPWLAIVGAVLNWGPVITLRVIRWMQ